MYGDGGILRDRSFRRLFLARSASLLGSAVAPIALAFAVLDRPGASATDLGVVLAARSLAQVLLLLFGGVLADRVSRSRLMVASGLLACAAQAATGALVLTGAASTGAVAVLAAINGAAAALFLPASRGVVPQVVHQQRLQSANALLRLSRNGSGILGAALGGVLVAGVGAGWALVLDAVTFAASAGLLAGIRVGRAPRAAGTTMLVDLGDGWREFRSRRWVWLLVVQFTFVNACFAAISVLGPVTAQRDLGGAAAWSTILTTQAIGLVCGSLLAMRLRPRFPMRVATLGTLGFVPPFFLLAVPAPIWLIAAAMFLNGACVDIFEVLWDTALQAHVPAEALSRISSYDFLGAFALGPLSLAAVGPVAGLVGTSWTLVGAGSLLAVVILAAIADRSVRLLPAGG